MIYTLATGRSGTNHGPLAIRMCDYKGGYGRPHFELETHVAGCPRL